MTPSSNHLDYIKTQKYLYSIAASTQYNIHKEYFHTFDILEIIGNLVFYKNILDRDKTDPIYIRNILVNYICISESEYNHYNKCQDLCTINVLKYYYKRQKYNEIKKTMDLIRHKMNRIHKYDVMINHIDNDPETNYKMIYHEI